MDDLKHLVMNCCESELPKHKTELDSAVNQCMQGSSLLRRLTSNFNNNYNATGDNATSMILGLVKKMGDGCNCTATTTVINALNNLNTTNNLKSKFSSILNRIDNWMTKNLNQA